MSGTVDKVTTFEMNLLSTLDSITCVQVYLENIALKFM